MEQERHRISLLDAVVLLYHVHRGTQMQEVGFEDSERTLEQLTRHLSQFKFTITDTALESALWSCNLLDEQGEFWTPQGLSFDDWLAELIDKNGFAFDKFYNTVQKKKAKG
jgi:hypothetical protein